MKKVVKRIAFIMIGLIINNQLNAISLQKNAYQTPAFSKLSKNEFSDKFKKTQTDVFFVENRGQIADQYGKLRKDVLFEFKSPTIRAYITNKGISFLFKKRILSEKKRTLTDSRFYRTEQDSIRYNELQLILNDAHIKKENVVLENETETYFNYFLAQHPEGIDHLKGIRKITVKQIYKGIDWVIYCNDKNILKYDFIVHPGADPHQVKIIYNGAKTISLDKNARTLKVCTPIGCLTEGELFCYQASAKKRIPVKYLLQENKISFQIPDYDKTHILVIDPPLVWATYFGGNGDENILSIKCDTDGNVYIAGGTSSSIFPTLDPLNGGYYQGTLLGISDIFITKFDTAGVMKWSTYYGGMDGDAAQDIVLNSRNDVYLTGFSSSKDIPLIDPGGGAYYQKVIGNGAWSTLIAKFNAEGVLKWSTLYGTSSFDSPNAMCCDKDGSIFILGESNGNSSASNIPTYDPGAGAFFKKTISGGSDLFILKFDSLGVRKWATYYGGSQGDHAQAICADDFGNIYISGDTYSPDFPTFNPGGNAYYDSVFNNNQTRVFVLRFNARTCVRTWATFYGKDQGSGFPNAVVTDQNGSVYVTGFITGPNFPTYDPGNGAYFQPIQNAFQDVFILKFDAALKVKWATYYGGQGQQKYIDGKSAVIDAFGNFYIAGFTNSPSMPTYNTGTTNFFQPTLHGPTDLFLLQFDTSGVRTWATYYGGSADEAPWANGNVNNRIAVDKWGRFYATGFTASTDFPILNPGHGAYFQNTLTTGGNGVDAVLMKFAAPCNPATPLAISGMNSGCEGDTLKFTIPPVNTATSYTWTLPAGSVVVSGQGTSSISVIVGNTDGTICVKAINGCGLSAPSCLSFKIKKKPVLDPLLFSDPTICFGDTLNLKTVVSPVDSSTSYTWTLPTGSVFISGQGTLSISAIVGNTDGNICVQAMSSCGASLPSCLPIKINKKPEVNSLVCSDSIICFGATLNFKSTVISSLPVSQLWILPPSWNLLSPQGSNPGTIIPKEKGNICFSARNECGTTLLCKAITPILPIIYAGKDTTICPEVPVRLNASGGKVYLWYPSIGLSDSKIYNPFAFPSATTKYVLIASDSLGCTGSDTVIVAVDKKMCCEPSVSPDPVSTILYFHVCDDFIKLCIYDALGQLVYEGSVNLREFSIDCSSYASAAYFYVLMDRNSNLRKGKFIVVKE
jgi:hypothetical protein